MAVLNQRIQFKTLSNRKAGLSVGRIMAISAVSIHRKLTQKHSDSLEHMHFKCTQNLCLYDYLNLKMYQKAWLKRGQKEIISTTKLLYSYS
jgi:hypothetical protein